MCISRNIPFLVACAVIVILARTTPLHLANSVEATVEKIGLILMLTYIVGCTWCSLYLNCSKSGNLVKVGPYSVCRQPTCIFYFLGTTGAAAQFGSTWLATGVGVAAWGAIFVKAQKREKVLSAKFPDDFREYRGKVPRLLPNLRLWRDVEQLTLAPENIARTFSNSCLILLSIPVAEVFEYLRKGAL